MIPKWILVGSNAEDSNMQVTSEMKIKAAPYSSDQNDSDYRHVQPSKPRELMGLRDDDQHVIFVDVIHRIQRNENPWATIMHGLTELRDYEDVLLLRHNLNPVPLRAKFAKCGFASWAEERGIGEWYIYFYSPTGFAGAVAHPTLATVSCSRAMAAGA